MNHHTSPLSAAQEKCLFDVLGLIDLQEFDRGEELSLEFLYGLLVSMPHNERTDIKSVGVQLNHVHAMLNALNHPEVHSTIGNSKSLTAIVKRIQGAVDHLSSHAGGEK